MHQFSECQFPKEKERQASSLFALELVAGSKKIQHVEFVSLR